MHTLDLSRARWRKSSRSNGGGDGNCVEVAFAGAAVAVRDSKHPAGPVLAFPDDAWQRFLASRGRPTTA